MSLFAYDNEERIGPLIKADSIAGDKKDLKYYCSGYQCLEDGILVAPCHAQVNLCSYKASNKRAPYFKAISLKDHIDNCSETSKRRGKTNRSKIDDSKFDFQEFLELLTNPEVNTNRKRDNSNVSTPKHKKHKKELLPYKIAKVYQFCRGCGIYEPFGLNPNETIGDFFVDSRSCFLHKDKISEIKMVECYFIEKQTSAKYLRFSYPTSSKIEHTHDIVFKRSEIKDKQLENALMSKLHGIDSQPVVIVGEWINVGINNPYMTCKITSLNQIYIPRNNTSLKSEDSDKDENDQ